ncbi:MAG: hypothetical protein H6545_00275 [Bacteroidales bacterium]|nr:hypothetical protein [Bacteroidales bacterium]
MFAELTDGVRQIRISYLDEKGLQDDPDILVILPPGTISKDADDMKGAKTRLTWKPLNYGGRSGFSGYGFRAAA